MNGGYKQNRMILVPLLRRYSSLLLSVVTHNVTHALVTIPSCVESKNVLNRSSVHGNSFKRESFSTAIYRRRLHYKDTNVTLVSFLPCLVFSPYL